MALDPPFEGGKTKFKLLTWYARPTERSRSTSTVAVASAFRFKVGPKDRILQNISFYQCNIMRNELK